MTTQQRAEQEQAAKEARLADAQEEAHREQVARAVRGEQDEPIAVLPPPRFVTNAYEVELTFPATTMILGGMPADQETRAKMPWKERYQELRDVATAVNDEALPKSILDEGGEPTEEAASVEQLITVFRRDPATQAVSLAANQIRTALQAAASALYEGQTKQYFALRKALRGNFRVDPTLMPLLNNFLDPITEPTGIIDLPRPIRRPPYERSVVARAEYVEGPFTVAFRLGLVRTGKARVMTGEVVETLLSYVGEVIGLGSHRGLDNVRGLQPGMFVVSRWETATVEAVKPPTLREAGKAEAAPAAEES